MRHLIGVLALTLPVLSCDKGTQTGVMLGADEPQPTQLPRVEVKLPPSPSFQKDHAKSNYEDGSFSLYGLRKATSENLDKDTKVRGYVVEVYVCPSCPRGAQCDPCTQPHFWIADKPQEPRDKAMIVVGFPEKNPETKKPLKFRVGDLLTVSGRFTKTSDSGFRASDGLLVYANHEPTVSPSNSKP